MMGLLGFDCSKPFSTNLLNQVQASYGRMYWIARYEGRGGTNWIAPLTTTEIQQIMAEKLALLPVFNNSLIDGGTEGTYAIGKADAKNAIAKAQALGIPVNTYLATDVEYSAKVTGAYLEGWADTMRASQYAGAGIIYCAPLSPNFASAIAMANAADNANIKRLFFWSATPEPGMKVGNVAPAYAPDVPSGFNQSAVVAWQLQEGTLSDQVDLDEADISMLTPQQYGQFMLPPGGIDFSTVDKAKVQEAIGLLQEAVK